MPQKESKKLTKTFKLEIIFYHFRKLSKQSFPRLNAFGKLWIVYERMVHATNPLVLLKRSIPQVKNKVYLKFVY